MRTENNIIVAFVLNFAFSLFEFFGGIFTGSVAIISDAIHDLGDSISVGLSYFFEIKSKKQADNKFTYGYSRYSVLGGLITTLILIIGSILVIYNAIKRIINPVSIYYNGMIFFAIIGIVVNLIAALFTHKGKSLNQKAVNLHMLEDVLGWIVVLIGAVIIKFTSIDIIDPIMSIIVAIFILICAIKNLIEVIGIFLDKVPKGVNLEEIETHLLSINGVKDIRHIHVWSLDGNVNCATMHVFCEINNNEIKKEVKEELKKYNINHTVIEIEIED